MASQFVCILLLLIAAISANAAGIEGGVPAKVSDRSYIISFYDNGKRVCAGALIAKNFAVTAGSCFAFYDVRKLTVGVLNDKKFVKVLDSAFSARFGYSTRENDIAVLRLTESVDANYLTLASSLRKTDTTAILTGWDANNNLVDVDETVTKAKDCVSGKYNYKKNKVFDSMLCGVAKDNACGALPGSPLVSGNKLIGLASWDGDCDQKGNPSVFTSIAAFKKWIQHFKKRLWDGIPVDSDISIL